MATDLRLKETLPEITESIVETYAELGRISHLGHSPLPSREVLCDILSDLMEILYPGFRRRQNLHFANIEYHVGDLVDGLHEKMTQQIARALRHEAEEEPNIDLEALAQQKTVDFLRRLPDVRQLLAHDVDSAFLGDPAAKSHHEIVFCYPGLEAISIYRLAHELLLLGVPLIPRLMTEWAHAKTGIDIHPGARIGPGFFIDHGHRRYVIGETCDIGKNVKLYQGVTSGRFVSFPRRLGRQHHPRHGERHPTLEDDVGAVYANATILGGDISVVGHHAIVGSSVWLTYSVGPYTSVTMEKPQLRIKKPETAQPGVIMYHI